MNQNINTTLAALIPVLRMNGENVVSIEAVHDVLLKNEGLENQINNQKMELAWKSGEIAGLKYAIRHFAKGRKEKK